MIYRIETARGKRPDVGSESREFKTITDARNAVTRYNNYRSLFQSDLPLKIVTVDEVAERELYYQNLNERAKRGFDYSDGWGTE